MMTKPKSIYELKLHEELQFGGELIVKRVPGGWNYKYYNYEPYAVADYNPQWEWLLKAVVFVPFKFTFKWLLWKLLP